MNTIAGASLETSPKLIALLDGRVVGAVHRDSKARLRFVYESRWRMGNDSYPLSLSMPLAAAEHEHKAIESFLWGLLPDNERTLQQYARMFGATARNPVSLLEHLGADCAGAVQLVPPERLSEFEGTTGDAQVEWIDDYEVARELRSVKISGIPGDNSQTVGRFSLAGAQPKIALFKRDGQWGRPHGRTPTTHILKPPSTEYEGFAENEHLCLALTAELGLGAARSEVQTFAEETAIVVERFDRLPNAQTFRRVHQEDMCQAFSVLPWNKYENEGGPDIAMIVALLQESSRDPDTDVWRFLDMIALNWALAATDAHAKNYALLHVPGGGVRLAPFYDVTSYLPYVDGSLYDIKLSMRIGKNYNVKRIARADWATLATMSKISPTILLERVETVCKQIPEAVLRVAERAVQKGLASELVESLAQRIVARSHECVARLQVSGHSDA